MPHAQTSVLSQIIRDRITQANQVLIPKHLLASLIGESFVQNGLVSNGRDSGYTNKFSSGQELTISYDYDQVSGRVSRTNLSTPSGSIRLTPSYNPDGSVLATSVSLAPTPV